MLPFVVETALVVIGAGGIALFLARFGGSLIGSDELLYLQTALNNVEDLKIANRFTHIYLLKFFLWLSPDVLTGARFMWAIEVAVTAVLVYIAARMLAGRGSQLIGLLAVVIFLSSPFIALQSGGPSVDVTAMTVLAVVLVLYLYSTRHDHSKRIALLGMGFALVLAFKAKEITIVSAVLLIGLGLDGDDRLDGRSFLSRGKWCLAGIVLGLAVFAGLNAAFLHDPWFGLRPGDLVGTVQAFAGESVWHPYPANWYTTYILPDLALPFVLFLLSGLRPPLEARTLRYRLVWLIPILLAALLTLSEIRSTWGILSRYFVPALPVMAALAPQLLGHDPPASRPELVKVIGLAILGLASLVALTGLALAFARATQWDFDSLWSSIISPLLFTLLIGVLIFKPRFSARAVLLPATLVVGLSLFPQLTSIKGRMIDLPIKYRVMTQFSPFVCFQSEIHWSPAMRMYLSREIPEQLDYLSTNRDELLSAFNIIFRADSVRANFQVSVDEASLASDLSTGAVDYVLLTVDDWNALRSNPSTGPQLEATYRFDDAPCRSMVFGVHR